MKKINKSVMIAVFATLFVLGSVAPSLVFAADTPFIHIVTVTRHADSISFGPGNILYTYTVTNPGIVSLSNVSVSDNGCTPVLGLAGDFNNNNLLDAGERWIYTCQRYVAVPTSSVATAEGSANGMTAREQVVSTVLLTGTEGSVLGVSTYVPIFPAAGFAPEN